MTTKVDRRVFLRGFSYGALALALASVPQAAEFMDHTRFLRSLAPENLVEGAQVVRAAAGAAASVSAGGDGGGVFVTGVKDR